LAVVEAEGQNQHNSNQPGFGLPAFSSAHSASCAVQKAVPPLIWTALVGESPRIYVLKAPAFMSWKPPHLCGGGSALALCEVVSALIMPIRGTPPKD
jgi:hypothetical protein